MKKKMKKILSLGAVALAVAPMAGVVACGSSNDSDTLGKTLTAKNYKESITFKNGTLTIKKEITSIEPKALDAFYKENKDKLTTLTILGSIKKIESNVFTTWKSLTTINLNKDLKTIDSIAFRDAQLTSLVIPNSVTLIGSSTFANAPLTSLTLSTALTRIGAYSFIHAQLTSLVIPNSVSVIGQDVFRDSPLTSLRISSLIKKALEKGEGVVGLYAFWGIVDQATTKVALSKELDDYGGKASIFKSYANIVFTPFVK